MTPALVMSRGSVREAPGADTVVNVSPSPTTP
jgi:hypothetical protein